jgi:uncharacterized protein (TIGR00255 family)
MNSMTGFGVARRGAAGWELRAEVQTLNGRFLSLRLQLADALRDLTPELEATLKGAFRRGTVHCRVSLAPASQAAASAVDLARLEALCRSVLEVRRRLGLSPEVSPEWLLAAPGFAGELMAAERVAPTLAGSAREAVEEAVARAAEVRSSEGLRLREYLVGLHQEMGRLVATLRQRAPRAVQGYREQLRRRVEELLAGTNVAPAGRAPEGEALEREVAYLAERSDVTEELDRIESHLVAVAGALAAEGAVGRTLEFLAQELGREAGTVAAKATDVEMTRLAFEFRTQVERVREQVANVE